MKGRAARAAAAVLLATFLLLCASGCGRKAKPEPRRSLLPTAAFHRGPV